jgi:hypothetical protein
MNAVNAVASKRLHQRRGIDAEDALLRGLLWAFVLTLDFATRRAVPTAA